MIEVNITATNYVVSSTSTVQNVTITSDNTIFTITNTVSPTISITNTNLLVTFLADGNVNPDPVFRTIIANTATIGNLIATSATIATLVATTGTFTNLTTENFNLNGLQYPSSRGAYGQVLSTNGSSYANWTNLGDLVYWSLNSDLLTNGYNIVSGGNTTALKIGIGSNYSSSRSSIDLSPSNGSAYSEYILLNVPQSNSSFLKVGGIGGNEWSASNIRLSGSLLGPSNDSSYVKINAGIRFPDGSLLTTANITTNTNTGTSIVPIATATRLGVVKIGTGLTIQEDGTLSGYSGYTLPAATSNTRGGVRLGSGITVTDGDIINVNSTTFITTSTNVGKVSLTEDMFTNGYYIKSGQSQPASIHINGSGLDLVTSYSSAYTASLLLHTTDTGKFLWSQFNNSEGITIQAPNIDLVSTGNGTGGVTPNPRTRIGTATTSTLYVQRIYNYAGTYAPTFPAGVQFADNSVQVTAWQTSTLYQQYIDFQVPTDP